MFLALVTNKNKSRIYQLYWNNFTDKGLSKIESVVSIVNKQTHWHLEHLFNNKVQVLNINITASLCPAKSGCSCPLTNKIKNKQTQAQCKTVAGSWTVTSPSVGHKKNKTSKRKQSCPGYKYQVLRECWTSLGWKKKPPTLNITKK